MEDIYKKKIMVLKHKLKRYKEFEKITYDQVHFLHNYTKIQEEIHYHD